MRIENVSTVAHQSPHLSLVEECEAWPAYPTATQGAVTAILETYRELGEAISVSFRDLVNWIKVGERATHYLHPYPAKLLPQIAHFFLACDIFAPRGGTVLDPFGGTGTEIGRASCRERVL